MENPERKLLLFLLLLPLLSVSCVSNPKSTVSWCVVSDAEEKKCLDLSGNATARHIKGTLRCVRGLNSRDCMVRIKNGTADAASMPADDVYAAGFCHGLELAAGESHNGVDGISYYVVAMARRSSSDLSLLEMHERSSCHPGIRTTVGWTVPIGYLVNTSQISVGEQCNFPKAIGNFFGYSCVPGVKDPLHDPRGNNPKNLCEACIGDENDRHICANNHRERHYGEAGALRYQASTDANQRCCYCHLPPRYHCFMSKTSNYKVITVKASAKTAFGAGAKVFKVEFKGRRQQRRYNQHRS